jgi:hypothetical protein
VALPSYQSKGLTIINDRCQSLPSCPVCGGITDLNEIVIERTAAAGGGRWVGYILRCLNSTDVHGLNQLKREGRLCTFAVPLTMQPHGWV